ncbi:hypothetical protein B0H14DRAFT_3484109 [Mycena olivaceomarginata]|nr:hypothetical protein B0H14DRAFT_3484109 [Mycena olivaceomarginata]
MGRYARGAGRGGVRVFFLGVFGEARFGEFLRAGAGVPRSLSRVVFVFCVGVGGGVRSSRLPGLVYTGTLASGSVFLARLCPRLRGAVSLAARAFEMLGIARTRSLPFRYRLVALVMGLGRGAFCELACMRRALPLHFHGDTVAFCLWIVFGMWWKIACSLISPLAPILDTRRW